MSNTSLKGGTNWKEDLREVIEEAKQIAANETEFIEHLKLYEVEIKRNGKDYSYLHPQKQKAVRGVTLGQDYIKTEVLNVITKHKDGRNGNAAHPITEEQRGICGENGERSAKPYFEGKTLGEIDRDFLQNYLFRYVENEKFRTAEKLHLILRCIFDLAASDYKLQSPMEKVVLPNYETKKGKVLTYDEERQFVEYCKKNNNYSAASALLLLLYTGMRRSELSSLTVLDDNWMQCETSKERMGSGVVTRRIPITPVMRRVLPFIDIEQAKATNLNTINTTIKRIFPNHHTHELRNTYITRLNDCVQ